MIAQAFDDLSLAAFLQLVLNLIEGEVDHVVVMQFLRRNQVAKAQPELVHQPHFV
jgi:hypothetical protein